MDLTDTIAPDSSQLDAVDLLSGPRVFTIESVSKGNSEQPVNIHLAEFPRPWRPGKSMRRVLVSVWGAESAAYVGRQLLLFCDTDVVFGGMKVGGVRIAALSDLAEPKRVPLIVTRGKSATYLVLPLHPDHLTNPDQLRALWKATTDPDTRKRIEDRVRAITEEQA